MTTKLATYCPSRRPVTRNTLRSVVQKCPGNHQLLIKTKNTIANHTRSTILYKKLPHNGAEDRRAACPLGEHVCASHPPAGHCKCGDRIMRQQSHCKVEDTTNVVDPIHLLYGPLVPTASHLFKHLVALIIKWYKMTSLEIYGQLSLNGNGVAYCHFEIHA